MSHSSRESNLAQLREALAQLNSEYFLAIAERRNLCVKIQGLKESKGRFSHYDPDREKEIFNFFVPQFKHVSIKELLAFSLIMEDQAMAMAPGSYPAWSHKIHLKDSKGELFEMVNPLMLKVSHLELFNGLSLSSEFTFLKDL